MSARSRDGALRILVLSYAFPPSRQVGGFRWAGLTKYLSRLGWRCEVVTRPWEGDVEVPEGVEVHRVPPLPRSRDLYLRVRSWVGSPSTDSLVEPGDGAVTPGGEPRLLDSLREVGAHALTFPDEARGWLLRGCHMLRSRIDAFRPDVVVSTGPPHSVHLAAAAATRGRHLSRWCDLRDPWYPVPSGSPWLQGLHRRMEEKAMAGAAGILTTTPELSETLGDRYPSVPVRCLLNAVDGEAIEEAPREPDTFTIVHVGTLYGGRDPSVVLRGFEDFLRRHPGASPSGARVELVGSVEVAYPSLRRERIEELGIGPHLSMPGPLPRKEALERLARSAVAVVLAQRQKEQIPAKLYECLAFGKPTLIVTEPDSATARVGEKLGGRVVAPDDVEGVSRFLRQVWCGEAEAPSAASGRVRYEARAQELADILTHRC